MHSIKELDDDAIGYIFTFLSILEVYKLGQCNTHLSQFLNDSSPIWQSLLSRYTLEKQFNHSYKEVVKEQSLLKFDVASLNPKFISPDTLSFSNNNRTVTFPPINDFTTIKTTKRIEDGILYAWNIVLDHWTTKPKLIMSNHYALLVGLDNDQFSYYNQDRCIDIIGYNTNGYSYCLGNGDIYGYHSNRNPPAEFKDGDIIQCVVDTRYPRSIHSASFSLYKIESSTPDSAIELCLMKDINLKDNGPFYPAISLIFDHQITLKPCSTIIWPKM
jgi:hypothetical protein